MRLARARSPRQAGFTLIEIAIAVVIIGLVIGAVLKGQELMTGARVRSIVQQHDGIKAAYFGFVDRFRQPPGDYASAAANIPGVSTACGVGGTGNGDGNSRIDSTNGEPILAWEHLSKSGFLNGVYTCTGNTAVNPGSVPRNPYLGFLQIIHDDVYAGPSRVQPNLKSGSGMPSDLLAAIDRKVDDGNAIQGIFRGSTYTAGLATDTTCWDANGNWNTQTAAANCGGATLY